MMAKQSESIMLGTNSRTLIESTVVDEYQGQYEVHGILSIWICRLWNKYLLIESRDWDGLWMRECWDDFTVSELCFLGFICDESFHQITCEYWIKRFIAINSANIAIWFIDNIVRINYCFLIFYFLFFWWFSKWKLICTFYYVYRL